MPAFERTLKYHLVSYRIFDTVQYSCYKYGKCTTNWVLSSDHLNSGYYIDARRKRLRSGLKLQRLSLFLNESGVCALIAS